MIANADLIANARMYDVSPEVGRLWRSLFTSIIATTGLPVTWLEHTAPAPLEDLWHRSDLGAVFMCGLPFSLAARQPALVAAPVPSPAAFGGEARYRSEFVVRRDSAFGSVADTFGRRIAFTVPGSQSGCIAALSYFQAHDPHGGHDPHGHRMPLFAEIVAPTITPLGALDAVVRGAAEIAPIDSYAFALLCAHRPDLTARVRVVGRTEPTPIPPLVASPGVATGAIAALSSAWLAAHTDPTRKSLMDRLLLERFEQPDADSYAILRQRFTDTTRYWRSRPLAAVTHAAFAW